MEYYRIDIEHHLDEMKLDLLVDELAGLGFESFETETHRLKAYVPKAEYDRHRDEVSDLLREYAPEIGGYGQELIPDQDWNALWESQYEPVRFGDFCFVHAPFHEPLQEVRYNVEIEPKMSFGTAHHPTTALMIRFLEMDSPSGESVLDMGCGTGILGILSAMMGASSVTGVDVDEWAFRNAVENVRRNGFSIADNGEPVLAEDTALAGIGIPFTVRMGDAALLKGRRFDRIMANINRNILLRDMVAYAECLSEGGSLYLSGFYLQDMEMLEKECNAHRLFYQKHLFSDSWAAMKFLKK